MSRRAAAWLAWSTCALSLALTVLSILLIVSLLHSDANIYYSWLETSMVTVGYSIVGAIVASRLPESPIGWLFCAIALCFGVYDFTAEYATYASLAPTRSLLAGEVCAWLTSWVWVVALALVAFLGFLFPDGRLPSHRWRWVAWSTAIVTLPAGTLAALSPGPIQSSTLHNPLGIEELPSASKAVEAFMFGLVAVAAASMLGRLHRAGTIERQQIKWFAYASTMVISGVILKNSLYPTVDVRWVWWVGLILTAVGVVISPIAMGIAIFRYRLYDIDIIINRTLVYGALTVVMAIIFQSIDATLHYLLVTLAHVHSLPGSIIAALVVGALFDPVRHRIQRLVDGFLHPGGDGTPGRHPKRSPSS